LALGFVPPRGERPGFETKRDRAEQHRGRELALVVAQPCVSGFDFGVLDRVHDAERWNDFARFEDLELQLACAGAANLFDDPHGIVAKCRQGGSEGHRYAPTGRFEVDTGTAVEVGTGSALGFELVGARGPLTLRSEFYRTDWSRDDASNPHFKGWYVEGSWFLTGEHAHYREGKFIRPNILSKNGAWELALRFSNLNLNDQDVEGGKEDNLSFAVNWYSQTHWRLMGNLIKVKSDGPYGKQDPWILQFRTQYFF
jgi:phosphate-selective porin